MATPDAQEVIITLAIPGHGTFKTYAYRLDTMMSRHLQNASAYEFKASVGDLKRAINKKAISKGMEPDTYDDLTTVTECLMVLAELHGYGL